MKKILLLLLVAGMLGVAYAWKEYNRAPESMATAKTDVVMTAEELFSAFSTDETAANAKYLDKVIDIKGTIESVATEEGQLTLTLKSGSDTGGIICKIDGSQAGANKEYTAGNQVTVKGVCTGLLMDVVLERCVIN